MNLRETTRDLIVQVEQQTSIVAEVLPDAALATMSTMASRCTSPARVIRYTLSLEHD